MRRKEAEPLQKVTILLFEGDMEWLQGTFQKIGASRAIRRLVRNFRKDIESKVPRSEAEELEHDN